MIKYVVIGNVCTMPDVDYYFAGFSKDGGIVHLSRYFEEAVISDLPQAQEYFSECLRSFGYDEHCEFRIEEVEI